MSKRERIADTVVVIALVLLSIVGCAIDMAEPSIPPAVAEANRG